jgi:hypothetical protein
MSVSKSLFRELNKIVKRFLVDGIPLTGVVQTHFRADSLIALNVPKDVFRASPEEALDSKA